MYSPLSKAFQTNRENNKYYISTVRPEQPPARIIGCIKHSTTKSLEAFLKSDSYVQAEMHVNRSEQKHFQNTLSGYSDKILISKKVCGSNNRSLKDQEKYQRATAYPVCPCILP